MGAIDTPRLVVAPADANTAQLILARPTHTGSVDEAGFVEPVCPQCGAADPVLESVDPTNEWRCESCDHVWRDEVTA
jgi:hypothetical protein